MMPTTMLCTLWEEEEEEEEEEEDCSKLRIISEVCVRYMQSCVYVRTFALVIAPNR